MLLPKIVSFFLLLIIFFNGSEGYCLQQEDYDTEDVHISIHSKTPSPRSLSSETGFSLYPLSSSRTSSVSDITLAAPSHSIAKLPYDCWKLVLSFLKVTQTPNLVLVLSRIYDNIGLTTDRIGVITNSTLNNDFESFNQKEFLYLNTDDTNSSNDFLDFMLSSSQPIVQSFSLPCCTDESNLIAYRAPIVRDFSTLTILIVNKTINTSEKVQAIGNLIKQSPHLTHLDVANNFGGLTVDFKESSSQFKRDMKFGEEFWKILLTQDSFPSLTYFNCQGNRASLQKSHIIDVLGKMPNLKILEMADNGEILTEISTISLPSTDITTFLANVQELRFNRTFLFKADLFLNILRSFQRPLITLYLNGCNLSQDRNKVVSFIGNYSSSLQTVTLRDNQLGNEILQEIIDIIHKEQQSRNIVNCVQLDVRENPEITASKITKYNTNHVSVRFN